MDSSSHSPRDSETSRRSQESLAAPLGGIVSLVCFFMPWVGCMGQEISGSQAGGVLWLVFWAALGIVGAYFHFRSKRKLGEAQVPIISCAVVGLVVMVGRYLLFLGSEDSQFFSLRFGSIATLLGFATSIFGATRLTDDDP